MDALKEAKVLYSTCFFITANFDALISVGKYALESNKPMGLNLSATFLIQFEGDKVREALEYADIVFANEDEADYFGKYNNIDNTKNRTEIAKAIAKWPKKNSKRPRHAIVTQGPLNVILASTSLENDDVTIQEFEVPALKKDELLDTNGAGDSFVGAFLAMYAQDKDLATCIKAGIYLSREVVMLNGCTFPAENKFEA